MDIQILVSSMLRAHGFVVSSKVLTLLGNPVVSVDYHPPNILLYAELDLESGFAYLQNIHINPKLRNRGVGTRLLAAYEEICKESKLAILIDNNRNPAFWKRQGYRQVGLFRKTLLRGRLGVDLKEGALYKKV